MPSLPSWLPWRRAKPTSQPRTRALDAAHAPGWVSGQSFGGINSEIGAGGYATKRRAAFYARNNAWIANGVSALVSNAIGAGIKPMPAHPDPAVRADLAARFNVWTATADADGVTDFYGLQALAVRAMAEAGECFAQLLPGDDGLRVRLLDSEMVPVEETRVITNGARVLQGVELAADGTRVAYHVRRDRPDLAANFAYELVRLPADQMAHMFVPLVPGQMRGLSWLAPVLLRLRDLDDYEAAQLVRQKIAACFAGFVVAPDAEAAEMFSGTTTDGKVDSFLEPGTLKVLPGGTDIRFGAPALVGDGMEFAKLQLRAVAAGIGVPEYLLTGDLSQANYSSLRAALVEFRQRVEQLQYQVIAHQLLRPIWRAWITNEMLAGRISGEVDDLLRVEFIMPAKRWVDPAKDATAEAEQIRLGLKSRRQAVAEQGWDIEALDAEIAADRERERGLGLDFSGGANVAADPAG